MVKRVIYGSYNREQSKPLKQITQYPFLTIFCAKKDAKLTIYPHALSLTYDKKTLCNFYKLQLNHSFWKIQKYTNLLITGVKICDHFSFTQIVIKQLTFFYRIRKKMPRLTTKEKKAKFDKLSI